MLGYILISQFSPYFQSLTGSINPNHRCVGYVWFSPILDLPTTARQWFGKRFHCPWLAHAQVQKWTSRGSAWAWLRGLAKSSAPNQTSTPIGWACQLLARLVLASNQTCPYCLKLSIVEVLLTTILSCLLKITILFFAERTEQVANRSTGNICLQIFHSWP